MLFINNFYSHGKEAVSNQIELLRKATNGTLFSASLFLNQAILSDNDVNKYRYIVDENTYNKLLPLVINQGVDDIHYFQEEIELDKQDLFNSSNRRLYISMYRRPTIEYGQYLLKFKKLKKVFVEMESHKTILQKAGVDPEKILVANTPPLISRPLSIKVQNSKTILFASWNGGDLQMLKDRGVIYLLNIIKNNPTYKAVIILRDRQIEIVEKEIDELGLKDRVKLIYPKTIQDLQQLFYNCSFVSFFMQKQLTKDIPNSVIDGIVCGKPILMTNVVDFHNVISDRNAGIVIPPEENINLDISEEQYQRMSQNAYNLGLLYSESNYISKITESY